MRDERGIFAYDRVVCDGMKIGYTPLPYEETLKAVQLALNTDREARLRKALIELGWTPPNPFPSPSNSV